MNVERVFRMLVGLGATWVLWLMIGLSVIAVAVILERSVFFMSTRASLAALRAVIARAFESGDFVAATRKLDEMPSLEARIVSAGLNAQCAEEASERMAAESAMQRLRSEKSLSFLGTLGNNAPFVGLLGTVVGIIGAFAELDASGGQLSSGLMAEIGEALVATAVGLLVALPAVASYNAFQRAIAIRLGQGEALGKELLAHFIHQRRQRELAATQLAFADARRARQLEAS